MIILIRFRFRFVGKRFSLRSSPTVAFEPHQFVLSLARHHMRERFLMSGRAISNLLKPVLFSNQRHQHIHHHRLPNSRNFPIISSYPTHQRISDWFAKLTHHFTGLKRFRLSKLSFNQRNMHAMSRTVILAFLILPMVIVSMAVPMQQGKPKLISDVSLSTSVRCVCDLNPNNTSWVYRRCCRTTRCC